MKFSFRKKGAGAEGSEKDPRVRRPRLMDGQESYTFRRSRTLTGSLSGNVGSTNAKRPDLRSERLKLHDLHRHRRLLSVSLAVVTCLTLAVGFLVFNSVGLAQQRFMTASSMSADDEKVLRGTISDYINRHPTQAFLINLDIERLTQFMQAKHPEVASVQIDNTLLGAASNITVRFRQPIVTWQIAGNAFYVDESGVAFAKNYGTKPALYVEDTSGYTPEAAAEGTIASKRLIGYLGQLLGVMREEKVGIVERIVIPVSIRQLDLYIEGREYPIRTHIDRDPYIQAQDLKSALAFLDERQLKPEYVDVRVEGKAYYR